MRKAMFVLTAFAALSFAGCKKDHTCSCKGDVLGTIDIDILDSKKGDAEDVCDTAESTYKIGDSTVSCSLE